MNDTLRRIATILWIPICVSILLQYPSTAQTVRGTDIAVVVHPDTPVTDLSLAEVRKVLLGERQYWT
ncbi:MAG TPA: hypothetical protein VEL77_07460, partial [Rugosimonospora sp.]|nr:hypothetical protein [Rugosimonospora sp.]